VQARILGLDAERDLGEFAMHGLTGGVSTALRYVTSRKWSYPYLLGTPRGINP